MSDSGPQDFGRGHAGQNGHLPSEALDRMILAALTPAEREGAEAHVKSCERCRSAFEVLKADCDHFEREVMPRTLGRVRQQLDRPGFDFSWEGLRRLWPAAGLAAMAAAALLLVPRGLLHRGDDYDIGVKGGPTVQVFGMHDGLVRPLATGSRVTAGDRLRFVVESSDYEYLIIVSVDGDGNATAFFPPNGTASGPVPRGRLEAPDSIELDNAKGPERLFGYFSHAPLQLDAVAGPLRSDPQHPPRLSGASPPVVIRLEKDLP